MGGFLILFFFFFWKNEEKKGFKMGWGEGGYGISLID
jgi:hypothetical protein